MQEAHLYRPPGSPPRPQTDPHSQEYLTYLGSTSLLCSRERVISILSSVSTMTKATVLLGFSGFAVLGTD